MIAPVVLRPLSDVRLFAPGAERKVEIDVTAARDGTAGTLDLLAPEGWAVAPPSQPFRLALAGDHVQISFNVKAPSAPSTAILTAQARVGNRTWNTGRVVIRYPHIPVQLLQPAARLKAVVLDVAIKGRRVGYIPGAGDRVAESLEEMGYEVTRLSRRRPHAREACRPECGGDRRPRLQRARRPRRPPAGPLRLTSNAAGRSSPSTTGRTGCGPRRLAPYNLRLSDARVTDENAPVTFLAADHPVLTTPNKITQADMEGWVQERGIYFPAQWDSHFTPILALGDPGESAASRGACSWRSTAGATSSTRGWFSSASFPPACPGRTGSSPTWSRLANDVSRTTSSPGAAAARRR